MSRVAVVNYGMGNLRSVANALNVIGATCTIAESPAGLKDASHIILPGVGAFGEAMDRLRTKGFIEALNEAVLVRTTPFLGICLGMQLLATRGFEHGENAGLDWIAGEVKAIEPSGELRVPHMGWNSLHLVAQSPLMASIPEQATFYFVHSFHHVPDSGGQVIAEVEYGDRLSAVIGRDHIFGTQFHPEKSQKPGLQLLRNFVAFPAAAAA